MFEVTISTVNTGRVQRKGFDTRERAEKFVDLFFRVEGLKRPRNRRDFRVEVSQVRPPVVREFGRPVATPKAA